MLKGDDKAEILRRDQPRERWKRSVPDRGNRKFKVSQRNELDVFKAQRVTMHLSRMDSVGFLCAGRG